MIMEPYALRRDPEDRIVDAADALAKREKMLDKTIADSFPASDPPSSLPDPREDSFAPQSAGSPPGDSFSSDEMLNNVPEDKAA